MKKLFLLLALTMLSCTNEEGNINQNSNNKVLILKVDYNTNTFLEGKEFTFNNGTSTFNTNTITTPNTVDGGKIEVVYQELNEKLFEGQQNWFGIINYPTNFLPANNFSISPTFEAVTFPDVQNIYNPNNYVYDYNTILNSVLYLQIVKNYRASNPNQTAKIFLFKEYGLTPNINSAKWIIIFKN